MNKNIKILWFYRYNSEYHFDHWFHLDYVRSMKAEGIDIKAYGPEIHQGYPDLALCPYNENLTMVDLRKMFDFDVFIINTKSRCFGYYRPAKYPYTEEERRDPYLPKDFSSYDILKIVIEEDYHYENSDEWYTENGIDLCLQRHYNNYRIQKERNKIDCKWLPFSVDTSVFYPQERKRINKICFAGSAVHEIYEHRRKALEILTGTNLLENFKAKKKEQDYINCLQDYFSHLSGCSIYKITPAKMFEIMASGSVLFTNEGDYGLKELFYNDSYVAFNHNNIRQQTEKILNDEPFREHTVKRGLECINERHTNKIRTSQLLEIINERLSNRSRMKSQKKNT